MKHLKSFEGIISPETLKLLNLSKKDKEAPIQSKMRTLGKARFNYPKKLRKTYSNDLFDLVLQNIFFEDDELIFQTIVAYENVIYDIFVVVDREDNVYMATMGENELGIFKDQLGDDIHSLYELFDEMAEDNIPSDFWEIN